MGREIKKIGGKMLDDIETPQVSEGEVTDLPDGLCFNIHMSCYVTPGCPDFEATVVAEIHIIEDWLDEIF